MVNDLVFSIAYNYALKMFAGLSSLTAMCACNGPSKTHDLTLCPFPSFLEVLMSHMCIIIVEGWWYSVMPLFRYSSG